MRISDWSSDVCSSDLPGGRIALLEVAEPPSRVLRFGHGIYFGKVVPLVGGLLSDPSAYRYLPRSVAYLPDPGEMLGQLAAAGFVDVERRLLSVGIAQLITATRRAPAPADGSAERQAWATRSEEHTSELQSLMRH